MYGWNKTVTNPYTYQQFGIIGTGDDFISNYSLYTSQKGSYFLEYFRSVGDSECAYIARDQGGNTYDYRSINKINNICNIANQNYFFPTGAYSYLTNGIAASSANIFLADSTNHTIQAKSIITGLANAPIAFFFTNDSSGYMFGKYNTGINFIKKTINYAATWTDVFSSIDTLRGIYFPTQFTGYIVGDSGSVFKTSNSGLNWNSVNLPVKNKLLSVNFFNADTGYVGGVRGVLYKTINGGLSWNAENSMDTTDIVTIKMVDDSTTYFTTNTGYVYKNNYYVPTSIKKVIENKEINLFPNPAINTINITIEGVTNYDNSVVSIYNFFGELVKKKSFSKTLDIDDLQTGIYFIMIEFSDKINYCSKFIKE